MTSSNEARRFAITLLVLRLTVFLVMLIWTIDKFVRPAHAISIFEHFYGIAAAGKLIVFTLATLEAVLLLAFVLGLAQRFTYGVVLLLHGLTTFASFRQYFAPFEKANILFFAAWPMLGACFALYFLRDLDTIRVGAR